MSDLLTACIAFFGRSERQGSVLKSSSSPKKTTEDTEGAAAGSSRQNKAAKARQLNSISQSELPVSLIDGKENIVTAGLYPALPFNEKNSPWIPCRDPAWQKLDTRNGHPTQLR
ncbi:MAG: hypothetical protein E5X33_00140 [Mesorhizobium sp.]|uniref:hypothetical protein n=1 Tax=Mesorhizobium sp. TaxID=1871066 RepID=UPI00122434C4|nr:hypothetical protein [Mesorhizobium sp.]TIR24322.1 MAG: hypothetical protein E5X33_00140 [Mesorhizobium sp.]